MIPGRTIVGIVSLKIAGGTEGAAAMTTTEGEITTGTATMTVTAIGIMMTGGTGGTMTGGIKSFVKVYGL